MFGGDDRCSLVCARSDVDGSGFDVEDLLRRPAGGRELHGGWATEVGVGAGDEVVVGRPLGGGVRDGAEGVSALVMGGVFGDGVGDGVVVDADAWLSRDVVEVADAEPDGLRLLLPSGAESFLGDGGRFGGSGDERGDACGSGGVGAAAVHLVEDLSASLGECAEGIVVDAGDLGDAVAVGFVEECAGGAGEVVAGDGLEDGVGGVALFEDGSGVEGGGAAVGSGGEVGDDDVTVRAGVAGSAGAVEETGGEEAVAVEDLGSGVAAADVAGGLFEVADGGADAFVECAFDGGALFGCAEGPVEAERFREREREVVRGDASLGVGEGLAGRGVSAVEDGAEGCLVDRALESETGGEGAMPSALGLGSVEVVAGVVDVFGEVVVGGADLAVRDHE